MNGRQVCQCQGTVAFLLAGPQLLCINNDRNRSGNSLVAASGVDDYRHFAAIHTGIGACRSHGLCPYADIVPIHIQQHLADICTVIILQSFLGNRNIKSNLRIQDLFDIVHIDRSSKIPDMLHV